MAMHSYPYIWNYVPLVLQVLVALGLACGMVGASFLIGNARGRFTVRFYMVAMLFVLFDVEAVFVLPWAVIFRRLPGITGSRMFGFYEMLVYLGFVAVGLFYVWKKGILNWANDKGDL